MLALSNYDVSVFQQLQLYIEKNYVPDEDNCKNKHEFLRNREKREDPLTSGETIFVCFIEKQVGQPRNIFCDSILAYFNNDFDQLAHCCKKACLSKENINKIWEKNYLPSKVGVCKILIAAGMNFECAMQFFKSLDILFYNDDKFDIMMMFFFENGIFEFSTINKMLYLFGLPMLCYGII